MCMDVFWMRGKTNTVKGCWFWAERAVTGFLQRLPERLAQQRWTDMPTERKRSAEEDKTVCSICTATLQQDSGHLPRMCNSFVLCKKVRGEAAKLGKCMNICIHETEREKGRRGNERGSVCGWLGMWVVGEVAGLTVKNSTPWNNIWILHRSHSARLCISTRRKTQNFSWNVESFKYQEISTQGDRATRPLPETEQLLCSQKPGKGLSLEEEFPDPVTDAFDPPR